MLVTYLCIAPSLHAQFGPPEPQGSGPKLDPPTVFPEPGTFPTPESVTLMDTDPHATIHYTWDGSTPTSKSPVYDPLRVLFDNLQSALQSLMDKGGRGTRTVLPSRRLSASHHWRSLT
jgi:hypothetical protein